MIKLDENYRIQNNNLHGVELVFEELREKEGKERLHTQTFYYPNPAMAIRKWIAATSNECETLSELENHLSEINTKLDKIQEQFINNNRKL